MSDLETMVRQSLADEASHAPDGAHLLRDVVGRLGARRAQWHVPVLAMSAVVLLLVAVSFAAMRAPRPTPVPAGGAPTPVVATPLVTAGQCAGLSLRIEHASPDGTPGEVITQVQPGAGNALTMDGNDLVVMRATGPCADLPEFTIVEPAGADRIQGASGLPLESFGDDGTAPVMTHADSGGTARITITWGCSPTWCIDGPPLAEIEVTVVAPFLDGITHEPSPVVSP